MGCDRMWFSHHTGVGNSVKLKMLCRCVRPLRKAGSMAEAAAMRSEHELEVVSLMAQKLRTSDPLAIGADP